MSNESAATDLLDAGAILSREACANPEPSGPAAPLVEPAQAVGGMRKTFMGVAYLSLSPLLLNALSVPAMALIIRRLGPANYGQWVTATALVGAVGILTSLGLRGKFVRTICQDPASAPRAVAEQLGTCLALTLVAMTVAFLACLALGYSAIVLQCTIIASIAMFLSTGATTLLDLLQALERFPTMAWVNLISGLLLTIASVLVILAGGGPVALSLAYLLGPATTLILFLAILRHQRFPVRVSFHPRQARRLLWDSRQFTAQQLLRSAEGNAVGLMLPKLIGAAGFGIFSAGALLGDRLAVIPDAIGTTLYPMLSKLVGTDPRRAAGRVWASLALAVLGCACIAIAGTLLAGTIARIILPKAASDCQRVIIITIWTIPLLSTQAVMGYTLLAAGKEKSLTRVSVWATVVNLSLGVIAIGYFGFYGACVFMVARSVVRICAVAPIFVRALAPHHSRQSVEISNSNECAVPLGYQPR